MEDLIYDRTNEDVRNKTLKAYHNYTDLNRIEEWCEYLANLLSYFGYTVNIEVKTDWDMLDERTEAEIERIRMNIVKIRQAFTTFQATPPTPATLNRLTYEGANAIEKILSDIDELIGYMQDTFVYSGVAGSGQSRLWQKRFRHKNYYLPVYLGDVDELELYTHDDERLIQKDGVPSEVQS